MSSHSHPHSHPHPSSSSHSGSNQHAIVVGAGVIGVASAYFLQRSGWNVTIVDRGDIGRGCSYANACLIVPSHSDPIPGPGVIGQALKWMLRSDSPFYIRPRFDPGLFRFALSFRRFCNRQAAEDGYRALLGLSRASLTLYEELTSSGDASFFFEREGLLELCLTEDSVEHAKHTRETLAENGFVSRLLRPDEAQELEPALNASAIRGALYIEGEAHGFSYGYVRALAETVKKRGGRILTGRPFARFITRDRRVTGVALEAPQEEIEAEMVVLAAGSWSRDIARTIGIEIPLQPAKGYSATFDNFPGGPKIPLLIKERRVIVTPIGERLRFGGTLELAGFNDTIDPIRYGAVVRAGRSVLREPPLTNEEPWCGLRPVTPDGLPIIDRPTSREGLVVATGHAMLGLTQSPMTGKLVSELANGEDPSLPLAPFRLDRFRA